MLLQYSKRPQFAIIVSRNGRLNSRIQSLLPSLSKPRFQKLEDDLHSSKAKNTSNTTRPHRTSTGVYRRHNVELPWIEGYD